ncbi:MAG: pitrilysin family protein [Trichodesmium sp. St16_bin4-tuft]|nr:pitrilysin family protein [Trichodesmium sp. St2_bin6]MDE5090960.1 pitrilysin family protein [Trichodesmium sp. St18_bin3_1_1]MDE5098236.1 pitrilysin family protein [Trichodesmium sp. St16_bin4-tuft]MDE5104453.1 pitrilysin family protein [Trichodesmium sp. St19_bin2]
MLSHQKKITRSKLFLIAFLVIVIPLYILGRMPAIAITPPKHYTELEFPPLPKLELPEYTRFQLENGIVVYLMEDHELPLIGGRALFRTGSRFEPENQVGLANLTGTVMRTGGTSQHSSEDINQLLEQKAAAVETGIGGTAGSARFSCLTEDLTKVFELFTEVIREPVFTEEKLNLAKQQWQGNIARRNDDPGSIASREFQKLIYGRESPYARTVEYETLNNISQEDLIDFYTKYFHPENMILGIVGDFNTKQMRSLVTEKLGDWQPSRKALKFPLPKVTQVEVGNIFFVEQPQLNQSYIQMGHLGGRLDNPDYTALSVMNSILNGLGGRLLNNIRSRQGLAYSVSAYWSANYDYPGVFVAGGQTRSDATVAFIQSINEEIELIRTQPITQEELKRAKDSALNSFIFNFQDPAQTLSRLMRYEYYDYPQDFIFRYRQELEKITVADVQRVAQKYLQPEKMVTLVVGNKEAIQPPLSTLGDGIEITSIDITIPEPS